VNYFAPDTFVYGSYKFERVWPQNAGMTLYKASPVLIAPSKEEPHTDEKDEC